jgi:hypothetical protein
MLYNPGETNTILQRINTEYNLGHAIIPKIFKYGRRSYKPNEN